MFELIESCPEQREGMGWSGRIASALTHLFLISAAVAATNKVVDKVIDGVHPPVDISWPVPQPQPSALVPAGGSVSTPPVTAPITIPSTIPDPGTVIPDLPAGSATTPAPWTDPGPISPLGSTVLPVTSTVALDVRTVDEPPELLAHPPLHYPDALRQAGIEGRVIVEAVVDTLGRAEAGSLRVVSSAHPMFEPEALGAVLGSRYRPARMAGHRVRVRIRVPVTFQIQR